MEKMKNGLRKFREVNHKEHRRQMYEQWGNRIISKINMWENSKEFKSINVLLTGGRPQRKDIVYPDFVDRCRWTFKYNLIEEPKVNDIKNALNLLKLRLMNEDFGFLQEGDHLSVITDKKRTFYPVIIVKSNELVLYIYEGLLGEEVKNGEIIFY